MSDEKNGKSITDYANNAGFFLRQEYSNKDRNTNKLNGISYRLLNTLKTNNRDMFMDTLLNCYLYVGKSVPKVFLDTFKDDDQFRTIGYAFVTGLISDKSDKKEGENNNGK